MLIDLPSVAGELLNIWKIFPATAVASNVTTLPSISVHSDFLYHFFNVLSLQTGSLPLYIGIGVRVTIKALPELALRVPVGISYLFESVPLDVFFEIAPSLSLFPPTAFNCSGGIGLRFYFQ